MSDFFFPWSDMMHDEIVLEKFVSQDAHLDKTYGSPVSVLCRIAYRNRMVRTLEGEEKVSSATIYCAGDFGIDVKDRITLPDGSQPVILLPKVFSDDLGNKHQEVMV